MEPNSASSASPSVRYTVTGMSCAACSARVEKAVSHIDGVTGCAVNLLTGDMRVSGDASAEAVIAAVEKAGYGASLAGKREGAPAGADRASGQVARGALADTETPRLKRRLRLSLLFLVLLMAISMGHMLHLPLPDILAHNVAASGLTQLLLSLTVLVINGRFFYSGTRALLRLSPNMDTLVALGAAAAFGYSTVLLYVILDRMQRGMDVSGYAHGFYFESAAMIVTLITVGKLLEARSKGRTTDALRSLLSLSPKTATRVREGKEEVIPAEELIVGDVFALRPGEAVPVDGVIIEGESALDESALTGESIPVDKGVGDAVSAATVNRSGFLLCRAGRVGSDTAFARIVALVQEASSSKAPIAKLADRVAAVFVPSVMAIALVTFLVWLGIGEGIGYALARGISVLVISCPCALGLATPVAIMVGSGVGAKRGILFKNAAALETAGRIKTVAFDKTGTLTKGHPRLTALLPLDGVEEETLLSLAYALEAKSEHPLARAICDAAKERGLQVRKSEDFRILPGHGLEGRVEGDMVRLGNADFIAAYVPSDEQTREVARRWASEGQTALYLARGEKLIGMLALADTLKEDSTAAIAALKRLGIRTVMLTGDNEGTARAIGTMCGVDEIKAELLPEEKEEALRALLAEGKCAMVGDGINDAPALTRADLGIAIGAGTDVAIDAADAVLMREGLWGVYDALLLGRRTLRNIKENLFWAFFYNVIGIPLAAGCFIPLLGWELNPMFGAAAMSLSSFCVVSNALRLNLVKLHDGGGIKAAVDAPDEDTVTVRVKGMMCEHCEGRVREALLAVDGIVEAKPDFHTGRVVIRGKAEKGEVKAAIEAVGYRVKGFGRG